MTEGTRSFLFGCHQFFVHPLCVLIAWRLEYREFPKWWEFISIFFHDIGVCGRQYLSDDKAKIGHWKKGAHLANKITRKFYKRKQHAFYGWYAYCMCAGHCPEESGSRQSKLSRADKRSWLVAPMIWLWWNYWVEWSGKGIGVTKPPLWKKLVKENLASKKPLGNHELYIKNRGRKE